MEDVNIFLGINQVKMEKNKKRKKRKLKEVLKLQKIKSDNQTKHSCALFNCFFNVHIWEEIKWWKNFFCNNITKKLQLCYNWKKRIDIYPKKYKI